MDEPKMGQSGDSKLMFQCECDEPEGKVIRSVYQMEFTPENIKKMWEKASKFKSLMGWEIPSFEHFLAHFLIPDDDGKLKAKGLCARIDDFTGIFWLTDINFTKLPHSASIHYTFFDRRHRGRIELCREAIKYCFNLYQFERLWTKAPLYTTNNKGKEQTHKLSVMDFIERIGFRREGRLKNDMQYHDKMFDSILYGLNKEETLTGEAFANADLRYTGAKKWVDRGVQTIQQ